MFLFKMQLSPNIKVQGEKVRKAVQDSKKAPAALLHNPHICFYPPKVDEDSVYLILKKKKKPWFDGSMGMVYGKTIRLSKGWIVGGNI